MTKRKSPLSGGSRTIQYNYTIYDVIEQFRTAILEAGINAPDDIIADGQKHRFSTNGKAGDTAGEYCLYLDDSPAGFFRCYRQDIYNNWHYRPRHGHQPSNSINNNQRLIQQQAQQRAKQKQQAQHRASQKAEYIWTNASEVITSHPYLIKKCVLAHTLKQYKQALVMPLYDAHKKLCSLQFIHPNSKKIILKHSQTQGAFYTLGEIKDTALICEGYATGATLHELTALPVIIAVCASNLLHCAKIIRQQHPDIKIIICADNDQYSASNTGIEQATKTAKAVNGLLAIPQFKDLSTKPTDFNDLYVLEGNQVIKEAFNGI